MGNWLTGPGPGLAAESLPRGTYSPVDVGVGREARGLFPAPEPSPMAAPASWAPFPQLSEFTSVGRL